MSLGPSRLLFGVLVTAILVGACAKQNPDEHFRKGNEFVSQGLVKEAVIEYRNALQIDPKRGDIRLRLADTLMLVPDTLGALREYVRAADLRPNDPLAQIKAGSLLLMAGTFEDAKARADKALAVDSTNAAAQILRGNALAGLKDVDGAMTDYQEALALNPSKDAAYGNIATIQLARGQRQEAEASFMKAVEVAPRSVAAKLALGNFLWASDRVPEAEHMFKEALAIDPANLSINRALGMLYVATQRTAEAEPYFQTIAKTTRTTAASFSLADYYVLTRRFDEGRKILKGLASKDPSHDAATIRLAAIDAAQGDRAQALSRLREVLERRPKEMAARLLVAQLLLVDGKADEALKQATSIINEEPNSAFAGDAYFVIGTIQASNARQQDAISAFEEVLKRQPRPLAAELALARLNMAGGAIDKAATYAQQALAIQPGNAEARTLVVRIAIAQRDFSKASETLASLEKQFPNSRPIFELQGELQAAQGHAAAARAAYMKSASVGRTSVRALTGLLKLDFEAGRMPDAVNRIETVLKRDASVDVLMLAARTYAAAKNPDKVEEMLTKAIQAQPGRLEAYALLGALYAGQERLHEAQERFEETVKRDPKSIAANTVLAMLLEMQRQIPQAEKQYKTVLALDSGSPVAANNLAWMYVSANRNLDEALQLAQAANQAMPDDPEINDTLGWVYFRKNMFDAAIRHLELSGEKRPDNAATNYHLGMAYAQSGRLDKGKKLLQRALAIAGDFDGADEARKKLGQLGG